MHGIGLRRRGVLPGKPERAETAFHLAHREADLFLQPLRADVSVTHDALGIASRAAARLSAARDHKAWRRALRRPGEGERIKRRLGRRIDLRAHIAARHRIDGPVEYLPFREGLDVMLVEPAKAV